MTDTVKDPDIWMDTEPHNYPRVTDQVRERADAMRERISGVDWSSVAIFIVSAIPLLLGVLLAAVLTVATWAVSAFLVGFMKTWRLSHPEAEDEPAEDSDSETIFHGPPASYLRAE